MTTFVVTLENPNKRAFIKPDLVPVRSKCTLSILSTSRYNGCCK